MLIRTLVAPLLGANCHLLVDEAGRCAVVDPGGGVAKEVLALITASGWRPVAILLTHGHVDHTWSAGALSETLGVPVLVHADDAYRLDDPFGTLGPLGGQLGQLAASAGIGDTVRPARLEPFTTGPDGTTTLHLAVPPPGHGGDQTGPSGAADGLGTGPAADAMTLVALHAPGHTEGSTLYLVDADGPTALTGDVLFAGSIGRTDLPGGDGDLMAATLRRLATLDPATSVLAGHGPASRVSTELATNPYLRPHR